MWGLLLSSVEASVLLSDVISRCAFSSTSPTITKLGFTIVRVRVVRVAGELYSLTILERGARCRKLGGRSGGGVGWPAVGMPPVVGSRFGSRWARDRTWGGA
jgi:hypothetical protein